jgi:sulfhydrogenase subunit beta (sulfur reductase)
MQKLIKKGEFDGFVRRLIKDYEFVAPTSNSKFEQIKDPSEMSLGEVTRVPAKSFFLPDNETLLEFRSGKTISVTHETKKRIIFGMRKCDLNAVKVMDEFLADSPYMQKRKNTILIGLFCEKPDQYCFCNSMELEDYYDLFIYPEKGEYYISIGSEKGKELVKDLPDAKKEVIKEIKNFKKLPDKNIEGDYQNEAWESDADRCLSCGACTVNCPTCFCFEISDDLAPNLKDGERKRNYASCMTKSFTEVAGGKAFRDSRLARFKHFVFHKIVYYKKRYGRYMCVGCGRCLRVCPPRIDWTRTINTVRGIER